MHVAIAAPRGGYKLWCCRTSDHPRRWPSGWI